jgi:phosphoserine aminotransferase
MDRVYNFSAGPSVLPQPVLQRAATELVSFGNAGMSVMEMSHRSNTFQEIITNAEALLRELLGLPDSYAVLFLQGGASTQFAMVPLNMPAGGGTAIYIDTGRWSGKAVDEAKRYRSVHVGASSKDENYRYVPSMPTIPQDADYVHVTTNNTIYGTRLSELPDTGDVPLVADMSSNILSEPMDIRRFALVYAGAQKNLGPAGVTVVLIRKDLLGHQADAAPTMLSYETHAKAGSLYNTPPCYAIYMLGLVLEWLRDLGGPEAMGEINRRKAALLYEYLDSSKLFQGTVEARDRSLMNVPFVLPTDEQNKAFIAEAEAQGFVNLKGHRSVGGMRASIYNAMPESGVQALVDFMRDFEGRAG